MQTTRQHKAAALSGAEIVSLGEGIGGVSLAVGTNTHAARVFGAFGAYAVILSGRAEAGAALEGLARRFARAGMCALVQTGGSAEALEAANAFLTLRGARKVALLAEGTSGTAALDLAGRSRNVVAAALLAPVMDASTPRPIGVDLSVLCADEDAAARSLARELRAELVAFPGAGASLTEVCGDVAAMTLRRWLPHLAEASA